MAAPKRITITTRVGFDPAFQTPGTSFEVPGQVRLSVAEHLIKKGAAYDSTAELEADAALEKEREQKERDEAAAKERQEREAAEQKEREALEHATREKATAQAPKKGAKS